jgi:precorrin-2/cobalt-factor-2 C20-methyltransferase
MKRKTGVLYGLGVGPGDPELITLKAARILNAADVVFAAASSKNSYSLAVSIARPHIPDLTPVKQLQFPMTSDQQIKEAAWEKNARRLIAELERKNIVAFLTLGDSMTYSTFGYVLKYVRILAPEVPIISVPGITAYQASAACLNTPLVEGEEALLVMSGVKGGERLQQFAALPENLVFMKAYRKMDDITATLERYDRLTNSVAVKHCGLPEQEVIRDIRSLTESPPNYWTLVMSKQTQFDDPTQT